MRSAGKLLTMLDGSHHGVQATPQQRKLLRLWIESAAAYPGTYAALGCGMIGNYAENNQVNTGADWPATKAAAEVIKTSCSGCHDKPARLLPRTLADERGVSFWQPSLDDPRLLTSRHIVFNLTRPDQSLMLLAPLAKEAGGWGLCQSPHDLGARTVLGRSGSLPPEALSSTGSAPSGAGAAGGDRPRSVFASTADPGYQAIRAMIVAGQEFLDRNKRFDMTGFVPRTDWFREMKRYGMVPQCVKPEEATDVYAIEQDYWKSLWHQPAAKATAIEARHQ